MHFRRYLWLRFRLSIGRRWERRVEHAGLCYHEVFHALTVTAVICHDIAIWSAVF
ncbi:MAG: hypothetical protein K2X97_21015 [Mycobacteriaceae bacterium]|nr:hypothetical protein [Mycobacteriaceae bacterium]